MPRPISDRPEIRPSRPTPGQEEALEVEARHRLLAQVGDELQATATRPRMPIGTLIQKIQRQ